MGADGVVTSIAPGGVDVVATHRGVSTYAPIIVYAPFVPVPPFDPSRVVRLGDDGPEIVVNRLIVEPAGDAYDPALARAIAADYGANVLRDWDALGKFLLEFGIDRLDALGDILSRMEQDRRVASWQLDFMFEPAQSGPSEDPDSPSFAYAVARIPEAADILADIATLFPVHIAVIDNFFPKSLSRNQHQLQRELLDLFPNARDVYFPDWQCGKDDEDDNRVRRPRRPGQVQGDDEDENEHGTAVTSVISGSDEQVKIIGSAGKVVPHFLHLYCHNGAADSIENSINHMKKTTGTANWIVNMSFAAGHCNLIKQGFARLWRPQSCDYGVMFRGMSDAIFVAGAGNSPVDVRDIVPAAFAADNDNVIAIGGLVHQIDPPNRVCGFAYGDGITVAAEGARIHFRSTNGTIEFSGGTSLAAPLVSGVAAMLRSINPELTPGEISEIIVDTARDVTVDTPTRVDEQGPRCGDAPPATWKDLDAVKAVEHVLDLESTSHARAQRLGSAEEQLRDQAPQPSSTPERTTAAPSPTPTPTPAGNEDELPLWQTEFRTRWDTVWGDAWEHDKEWERIEPVTFVDGLPFSHNDLFSLASTGTIPTAAQSRVADFQVDRLVRDIQTLQRALAEAYAHSDVEPLLPWMSEAGLRQWQCQYANGYITEMVPRSTGILSINFVDGRAGGYVRAEVLVFSDRPLGIVRGASEGTGCGTDSEAPDGSDPETPDGNSGRRQVTATGFGWLPPVVRRLTEHDAVKFQIPSAYFDGPPAGKHGMYEFQIWELQSCLPEEPCWPREPFTGNADEWWHWFLVQNHQPMLTAEDAELLSDEEVLNRMGFGWALELYRSYVDEGYEPFWRLDANQDDFGYGFAWIEPEE